MSNMKAVFITQHGGPEVLKFGELPKPTPGPNDLLVKVHAVALNPVDTKKRSNWGAGGAPAEPTILGWDASGVVESTGSDAHLFKPGDQVYFAGVLNRQGANAEYVVVDERIVGHKPKTLSHTEAAAVPLTVLTAWEGMVEGMHIPKCEHANQNKSVLVVGGAGGVGSIGIQLAKRVLHFGKVIGTASRPESIQFVKEMGADFVINHSKDFSEELQNIGLQGVDYILNTSDTTPATFAALAKILNPLGRICQILAPTGPVDLEPLFAKRAGVVFELMFTRGLFNVEPEKQGAILNEAADLLDKKVLVPRATVTLPFSKIAEAHTLQESGKVIGKIVLPVEW